MPRRKSVRITKRHSTVFGAALLMLFCSATFRGQSSTSAGTTQTQVDQQDKEKYTANGEIRKPSTFSGAPVVGEFQPQQKSPEERMHRDRREQRYGKFLPKPATDPGPLAPPETTNLSFIDYVKVGTPVDPPGIPASVSTAIVIGTVVNGSSFINKDHTFVYTDYDVRVAQILKQDSSANLTPGSQIIATRPGGAIHFPSGHITNFLDQGQGLPKIGSQYILFLWRSIPDLPEYEIIIDSGFEVRNNRVYPLDDANARYIALTTSELLGKIQIAMAGSATQSGGRP